MQHFALLQINVQEIAYKYIGIFYGAENQDVTQA
jgi:hypothetical protein